MAIKFHCPHCQKPLNVRDQFAGRRAACPACKKSLTVPTKSVLPAAPSTPSPELEELAAAALSDEPAAQEAPKTIDFTCFYCDAELHLTPDLAGKQTPCPECGRIIKVPVPAKPENKDWRKAGTGLPTGARRDAEPAPEGAWGSTSVTGVSQEALIEANAFPEVREKLTPRQWVIRGAWAGAGLIVLLLVVRWGLSLRSAHRETQLVKEALAAVSPDGNSPKLSPEKDAAVQRAAGEYYLRTGDPEALKDARAHFTVARTLLNNAPPGLDRELGLIELALTQLQLGGDKPEVDAKTRLPWQDALKDTQETLQLIGQAPDPREPTSRLTGARVEGIREVCRTLIERSQAHLASALATDLSAARLGPAQAVHVPEAMAAVGLELLRAQKTSEAAQLAELAQQLYEPATPPGAEGAPVIAPPPVAPSLVTLWLALNEPAKAEKLKARLSSASDPLEQTLTRFPLDSNSVSRALDLVVAELRQGAKVSPWVVVRVTRLAIQNGLTDKLSDLAGAARDPMLQGHVQLEALRAQLQSGAVKPELNLADGVNAKGVAHSLAVEAITRAAAKKGTSLTADVERMDAELHPFGYFGVVLGTQDKKQK
jgi:hypothetical protein